VADVDLAADLPVIRITKAWRRSGDARTRIAGQSRDVLGPPKSRRSTRSVALPSALFGPLRDRIPQRSQG
jgi:hypothetical protein